MRVVGVPGAVLMGLGSILGTGIFVSIGIAAGITGPSVIVAVAAGAVEGWPSAAPVTARQGPVRAAAARSRSAAKTRISIITGSNAVTALSSERWHYPTMPTPTKSAPGSKKACCASRFRVVKMSRKMSGVSKFRLDETSGLTPLRSARIFL